MKASTRCAAVAVTIGSWILVSNHCAFAAMAAKGDSTQAACPFHSKPAKEKQQAAQMQCCKVLRAVVLAKSKTWARDDGKFSHVDLNFDEHELMTCSVRNPVPLLLDTGPPGAQSFAELILQRSLFIHAPPFLA